MLRDLALQIQQNLSKTERDAPDFLSILYAHAHTHTKMLTNTRTTVCIFLENVCIFFIHSLGVRHGAMSLLMFVFLVWLTVGAFWGFLFLFSMHGPRISHLHLHARCTHPVVTIIINCLCNYIYVSYHIYCVYVSPHRSYRSTVGSCMSGYPDIMWAPGSQTA